MLTQTRTGLRQYRQKQLFMQLTDIENHVKADRVKRNTERWGGA